MTASNRASLITKTHKVLKNHYQPVAPPSDRTLLENLLYACCLEDAPFDKADEAFARLQQFYYDWNEVRVTTVAELSESMPGLPAPSSAARRLKHVLQTVFEAHYSYDLEFLKKENIGKAIKALEKYKGITPFVIGYVTQSALGGHSIPADRGLLHVMLVLGVISDAEAAKWRVPGMERAIPKAKGIEFASLVHQLGADYLANPFSKQVRSILLEIAPDAKERFPKRRRKKEASGEPTPSVGRKKSGTKSRNGEKSKSPPSATKRSSSSAKDKSAKSAESGSKSRSRSSRAASNGGQKKSTTKGLTRKKPR